MQFAHTGSLPSTTRTALRCWITGVAFMALLAWLPGAHAASVYQCVDAHGHRSFQDTPCPPRTRETRLAVTPQPLIGAPGEHHAGATVERHPRPRKRSARRLQRTTRPTVTSWECRAADGEVFYRHTRCPGSIAGDGVVRGDYVQRMARTYPRSRHDAWSRVSVHGTRVSRAEACRRIHAAGAAGRDGHLRDANVSAYARMTGHDPCAGD